jgi:Fur family transcriptional regulator, stress-responsive regulator
MSEHASPSHSGTRELLREHGLRATTQRIAVLDVLRSHPHSDADAVLRHAAERGISMSTQAAYDALAALTSAGLANRIEPAGSTGMYEARVGDNHHHVVCRYCGRVHDVDCTVGAAPCLTASDAGGFIIDEAEVTFWGVCPDCANR